MGSVFCCFKVPDVEENVMNPEGPNHGNCICANCFYTNLMSKYGTIFGKGEAHVLPSPVQGAASSSTAVAPNDNTLSDANRSHGRQLPNNANSQNARLQENGLATTKEKGTGLLHLELEPPRRIEVQINLKLLNSGAKQSDSNCDEPTECRSESSVKVLQEKVGSKVEYANLSSEDEDVCPTCLEEYTQENPKILTQCSHHYHLSCIYEWMERSKTCPVCGKLMVFVETA